MWSREAPASATAIDEARMELGCRAWSPGGGGGGGGGGRKGKGQTQKTLAVPVTCNYLYVQYILLVRCKITLGN